jgi:molybdopterin-containing oxidoreductase family membrane subunit
MKAAEGGHIEELFSGSFAILFWSVQVFGMILPIVLLLFKHFRKPCTMFIIALFIVLGHFKRYLIVTPTMLHPFYLFKITSVLPYIFTFIYRMDDYTWCYIWCVTCDFGICKLFPIIPIWEVAHEEGIDNETLNQEPHE